MKCQKETPCVATLNKQKCLFFFFYKTKGQKGRIGPVERGLIPVRGRRRWRKGMER
jgi:hypothetical protein